MSSAHSMNARNGLHSLKPYPSKAVTQGSSKVGEREKKTGKTEVRRLMERKAAQQNTSEELKKAYLGTAEVY